VIRRLKNDIETQPKLQEAAGKDGTALFEDIGHSEDARVMLPKFYVGDLKK
jgi:cytochrome b involved in lipid metabolism